MISEQVIEQILAIRDTGIYNMFDIQGIKIEAYSRGYYELHILLEEDVKAYAEFIMSGKRK